MRIYRDEHDRRFYLEFEVPRTGQKSIAHFTNDWAQLFRRGEYNWRTFNFIKLYFEDDMMLGGYEIEAALLGLGFRVRFNLKMTRMGLELKKRVADIESGEAKTVPFDKVVKSTEEKKMKKSKSKIVTIELETELTNKDLKTAIKDMFGEYNDTGVIKQIQVAAVDATK